MSDLLYWRDRCENTSTRSLRRWLGSMAALAPSERPVNASLIARAAYDELVLRGQAFVEDQIAYRALR